MPIVIPILAGIFLLASAVLTVKENTKSASGAVEQQMASQPTLSELHYRD